jgi:hypothetical protein
MKRTIKRVAPWLAAAAVSGALVLAPTASAATTTHTGPSHANQTSTETGASPFVPFGPWAPGDEVPYDPYIKNPGGGVDLPS